MHERLTWNPFDPAPYESAWSVFGKLLALNFCKPADITNAISRQECTDSKYLVFRDCNWIDFDRFSDLIGVAPNRLRAGFLQQLGFPQFSYRDGAHGIRFCPECLKFGYHSILFDLALVTECPIHQKPLQKGCTVCCNAIARTGLVREISPHQILTQPLCMLHRLTFHNQKQWEWQSCLPYNLYVVFQYLLFVLSPFLEVP